MAIKDQAVKITENTYISLGLLGGVIVVSIWAGRLSSDVDQWKKENVEIRQAIKEIQDNQKIGLGFRAEFDKRITILERWARHRGE